VVTTGLIRADGVTVQGHDGEQADDADQGGGDLEHALQHMRHGVDGRLNADDLTTLNALATRVLDRDDLTVRTTRTVWLARLPQGRLRAYPPGR
jgi:hypothetical protein